MNEQQHFVFQGEGTFEASQKAEKWCAENGFSVGRMQGSAPRGLMRGSYDIQKWRNLRPVERDQLDGVMESADPRQGPVTVTIFSAMEKAS